MLRITTILLSCLVACNLQAVDYLKFDSGKALTVLNTEAVKQIVAENSEGVNLELYDRSTGIILGDVEQAIAYEIGNLAPNPLCANLYSEDKKALAIVIGVERKKGDKVLPFTYLRVHKVDSDLKSGSLLFDESGKAVAFYYTDHDEQEAQGYAVRVQAVERAHADYQKNITLSRAWAGLIVSSTGTVPEIVSVRPDSPAAKAGIKTGDILTQVGERNIYSYLEAVNAFYYLIPGVQESFAVLRGGAEERFSVTPISRDSL